jgi:hypothetical protein
MIPRKSVVLLGIACLLALGLTTQAQAGIGAFAGINFPTGTFSNDANTGYQIGASYTMPLLPIAHIGAWGAYNSFGGKGELSFNNWELLAIGKVNVPITGLHGLIGLGFANSGGKGINGESSDRETDFAYALGAGWDMTLLTFALTFHQVGSETTANWFTLSAGVNF